MRETNSRSPKRQLNLNSNYFRKNEMKIQDEERIVEKSSPEPMKAKNKLVMKNFNTSRGHATLMSVKESPLAVLTSAKTGKNLPMFSPIGLQQGIPLISPTNESEMSSSFGAWRSEKGITINQGQRNRKGGNFQSSEQLLQSNFKNMKLLIQNNQSDSILQPQVRPLVQDRQSLLISKQNKLMNKHLQNKEYFSKIQSGRLVNFIPNKTA